MSALLLARVPAIAGSVAVLVGGIVLVGWALGIEVLKGAGHAIVMKPNAAVCLIACGISLLSQRRINSTWRRVAVYSATLAAVIGAFTFSEHLVGWNLGIDELVFTEPPGATATMSPARMGPNASLSFALAGLALVVITWPSLQAARAAQALALGVVTLATVAVVGYAYGARELYSIARYTAIAWPTALTLLIIAVGTLAIRSDIGPLAALASHGPGGIMARRLFVPAVLLPLTLGYVRVRAQSEGYFDTGLGTALLVVSLMLILGGLTWRTAVRLDQTNRAREAAMAERDESLRRERAAREVAENASRLKDEFLAALSHELRTPLNTILGWTEMLRGDTLPPDRRAHAADVIARNGGMLVRLIEDILDIARSATGRLHLQFEPLDPIAVARNAVEIMLPEAADKDIRIESRLDGLSAIVSGDGHRLQQVMVNLLANAVKFTPAGGCVTVEACLTPSTVELRVSDTGQGIDPEFIPHLFERFRQEDGTTTREHGGLGLGLAIVRELAQLHGGSVDAASDGRGHGSTFTVTLPLFGSHVAHRV